MELRIVYVSKLIEGIGNVKDLMLSSEAVEEVDIIFFEGNGCWTLEVIPQSFLSHLKSVELRSFDGNENDLGLVEFLLKNAIALQKVTIICSSTLSANPKKQFEVTKELLMLPRDSTCVIDFS
ncbi:hypothetical protein IFM89_009247 [Coptis chinensis]|uniref:FBD domain-containing protein n=1 Tax=Coptis chinensis TaxID=261450 RepID=A0A835IB70_9MAGN|nr:hypothetical protein IFM89_009247 [Coptis chinensis]